MNWDEVKWNEMKWNELESKAGGDLQQIEE